MRDRCGDVACTATLARPANKRNGTVALFNRARPNLRDLGRLRVSSFWNMFKSVGSYPQSIFGG